MSIIVKARGLFCISLSTKLSFIIFERNNAVESVCIFALIQQNQQSQCLKLGEIADVIKNSL